MHYFFCAPGEWTLNKCKKCDLLYLDPRPTENSIGLAYNEYYTHKELNTPPLISYMGIRRSIRNSYLNKKYGTNLEPSIPFIRLFLQLIPPYRMMADRFARYMMKLPDDGGTLLDVGCGAGSFLEFVTSAGWDAQGLDPDAKAVLRAKENGLKVEQGYLEEKRFANGSFNVITAHHVIEHMHNPEKFLHKCYRILKPGGRLWIATPNSSSLGHKRFRRYWRDLDPPRHLCIFDREIITKSLHRVGFKELKFKHSGVRAWLSFRTSATIAKRSKGNSEGLAHLKLFIFVLYAELRCMIQPSKGEEILVFAYKPTNTTSS